MIAAVVAALLLVPQGAEMPEAPTARTLSSWRTAIEPDEVELLVCFGCDEVRIRNAEMSLGFDLTVEAARHFRSVANGLWPDREPMDW